MKHLKSCALAASVLLSISGPASAEEKQVNILTWAGIYSDKVLGDFTAQTGNTTKFDASDSDDMVETKLLAGASGYDITTAPAVPNLSRLIKAGAVLPLDTSKITNLSKQDPALLEILKTSDPEANHGIITAWGTVGLAVNLGKVTERLADVPTDSYDLLFNPENAKRLSDCGIAMVDSPSDAVPVILNYLKLDPNSESLEDLDRAMQVLAAIKPYVRYLDSTKYLDDLANGNLCLAFGWSGDVMIASQRAAEAKNGQDIKYVLPVEGTQAWMTAMVIPAGAPHVEAAHAFLNYMLDPKTAAQITVDSGFASAVPESKALLPKEMAENPALYPSESQMKSLFLVKIASDKYLRLRNRAWTNFKTGN